MSVQERTESRLLRFTAHIRRQFQRWKDAESQTWERVRATAAQMGYDAMTAEQMADRWVSGEQFV